MSTRVDMCVDMCVDTYVDVCAHVGVVMRADIRCPCAKACAWEHISYGI